MKKWKICLSVMLIFILAACGGTLWHFRNEWQAVRYFVQYSPEDLDQLQASNEQLLADVLERAHVTPKPEHAETTDNGQTIETEGTIESNASVPIQENQEGKTQEEDLVLAAMAEEVYALRSAFESELDVLLKQLKEEYLALPKEQRAKEKMALAAKYMKQAAALEEECDSQIAEILSRMKQHLEETGGDMTLVDDVRTVYENEKALKKSQYMSYL